MRTYLLLLGVTALSACSSQRQNTSEISQQSDIHSELVHTNTLSELLSAEIDSPEIILIRSVQDSTEAPKSPHRAVIIRGRSLKLSHQSQTADSTTCLSDTQVVHSEQHSDSAKSTAATTSHLWGWIFLIVVLAILCFIIRKIIKN